MENYKKLRDKIRNIIMEDEKGFKNFFLHGEGGDHFPYEFDDNKKSNEEEKTNDKKAKELGMEPISGDGLHLTGANM